MKGARHQLILLGFISQGFSWDGYGAIVMGILLWMACLTLPRRPLRMNGAVEMLLLVAGCALGYYASRAAGSTTQFFFGHGLTFIQAVRLLRPMLPREKITSVFIACFQIGVACTALLDYRFLLLFVAMLVLIPRALAEMAAESFAGEEAGTDPKRPAVLPTAVAEAPAPAVPVVSPFRFSFGLAVLLLAGTVCFYLLFPRGFLPGRMFAPGQKGSDESSLADMVLDPTRGGLENSDRLVMQVQAEGLGYLRSMTLSWFDGENWRPHPNDTAIMQRVPALSPEVLQRDWLRRQVRVRQAAYLGKVVPTDGVPANLKGKFFHTATMGRDQVVRAILWNTSNNAYEYWVPKRSPVLPLRPGEESSLTAVPPQSARLRQWLDEYLADVKEPLAQARKLEAFFRQNFTYRIGAPALSRVNATDDFIFNQKEGHCERFAAHLTVLLRMQKIPSRIVVGYLPGGKSWLSGAYNIRFSDAHAWTEAWFPETGWVTLDATPASNLPHVGGGEINDFLEAVDYVWYSKVINFDGAAQSQMLQVTMQGFGQAAFWVSRFWVAPVGIILLFIAWRRRTWLQDWLRQKRTPVEKRRQAQIQATHFYGQMLHALARAGYERPPGQTPREFLDRLRAKAPPFLVEATCVTEVFCEARYAAQPPAEEKLAAAHLALKRLREGLNKTVKG